ncbi:MAG: amidase family protein, partial [Myxococcota bacterium]
RVLSDGGALHARALAARARVTAALHAGLADVDVLLGPTSPTVAFPLGARAHDPLAMYAADRFTVPASLAGLPALSVPGPTPGLPVGVHLVGRAFDEATLFAVAAVVEAASNVSVSS